MTTAEIKKKLDGRTQRWLALKIKMPENELSLKLKNKKQFSEQELKTIEKVLS